MVRLLVWLFVWLLVWLLVWIDVGVLDMALGCDYWAMHILSMPHSPYGVPRLGIEP